MAGSALTARERFTECGNETSNFFEDCINYGGSWGGLLVVYDEEKMQQVCTCSKK
jgi:hypothetical protein